LFQRYYIASARELVRINGTTKAPVMNYAAESMLGVITIRAFAATNRFIKTNLQLIDTDATLFFYANAALEWVLLRVEVLQILVIVTSSVLLIMLPEGAVAPGTHQLFRIEYFVSKMCRNIGIRDDFLVSEIFSWHLQVFLGYVSHTP
jgi:hypothetical protein